MKIGKIIQNILLFIVAAITSFGILLILGRYNAELLYFLGFFGLAGYMILDTEAWLNLNKFIKYIFGVSCSIIYRVYDLNNYQIDTRNFEYYDNGVLVKHEPEVKVFKFIDWNDLFLIMFVTSIMILIYVGLKSLISFAVKLNTNNE